MSGPQESVAGPGAPSTERAELLLETHRYDEALRALGTVLAQDPGHVDALCLCVLAHLSLQDDRAALQAADRALAADPSSEWALRLRSLCLGRLGDHLGAVATAREAQRLEPGLWQAHARFAHAAIPVPELGVEAWEAAVTAARLAPDEAEAHVAVGDVAASRKDRATAERAYQEALRLDPQNAAARNNLGLVRVSRGRFQEAAEDFVSVGALDPRDDTALVNLRVVVLTWMQRTHFGLWVVWWLTGRLVRASDGADGVLAAAAVLTVVGAAVLAWWTTTTVGRLRVRARTAVWRVLRSSRVATCWFAALVVAVVGTAVMAWVPLAPVRTPAFLVAGVALLVGCLVSWLGPLQDRLRRGR